MVFLLNILFCIFLVISYYYFFKKCLHFPAKWLAIQCKFTRKFTLEESKGCMGFILVVLTHVSFAILLSYILKISLPQCGFQFTKLEDLFYGLMLGFGLAGTSMLICLFIVKILAFFFKYPETNIMLALPGGWLRSYENLKKVMPAVVFLPLIILQLTCEELVFRGIFQNYLLKFGAFKSILASTFLFALMQVFLMPTARGAIFPVVGAMMMGFVHGSLFFTVKSLWPFIISHTTFFLLFTL